MSFRCFIIISRRRSSSSSILPQRELNRSSPKMRSMPDYLIYSLSNFLNFMSEGLYFVIERSSARQSIFYEERYEDDDPEPEEEEEEEDEDFLTYFFLLFYSLRSWRYFLCSALAAMAAAALSARYFSAACSISFLLIF